MNTKHYKHLQTLQTNKGIRIFHIEKLARGFVNAFFIDFLSMKIVQIATVLSLKLRDVTVYDIRKMEEFKDFQRENLLFLETTRIIFRKRLKQPQKNNSNVEELEFRQQFVIDDSLRVSCEFSTSLSKKIPEFALARRNQFRISGATIEPSPRPPSTPLASCSSAESPVE